MKKLTLQFCLLAFVTLGVGCAGNDTSVIKDSTVNQTNDTGAVMSGDINVGTTMKDSLNEMNGTPDTINFQKDERFILEAAKGGLLEVEMGKLTATYSASALVKEFGLMMVTDHKKANDELKILATKKNIKIATSLDENGKQHINAMKAMKGTDFDKAYVSMMDADHKEDIAKFEKEVNAGKDEEVKSFASATLPTLKKHYQKIKAIQEKMK